MTEHSPFYLPAATPFAHQVDHIFYALLAICGLVLLLVFILIWVFTVRYRRSNEATRNKTQPNIGLEITWTVVPLLIFIALFVWAGERYISLKEIPPDALPIQVVAKQWMWKFQHPGGQREIDALHLPVDRPIQLTMTSQDVIHSFFVPAFRAKQDVVPGRYTTLWFTPNRVGRYHLLCTQYCGTDHSRMRGEVVVMSPTDYQTWLQTQGSGPSLAQEGENLFRAHGCSGCHGDNSTVHAPSLQGVFGSLVHLESGDVVNADEAYIRDSILLPRKQVVAGYAPIMPSFAGQLSEEDILKLIAYIQSLALSEHRAP
ncbi:MAG: cytochrome c oxidase subunit II [Candidatus Competibacteraceae bacterium]